MLHTCMNANRTEKIPCNFVTVSVRTATQLSNKSLMIRPASLWGKETWPDLRLKWPKSTAVDLRTSDLTWQRHVDLSRRQTTWDVQKLWWTVLAWTLYVYSRLTIKCFYNSYSFGRHLFIVISWRKFVQSVKTVFYDCFDALQLQQDTASLAFCRPSVSMLSSRLSVCNRCIVANC